MIYIALNINKIVFVCDTDSEQGVIDSLKYENNTEYTGIKHIPNEYFIGLTGQDIREFDPVTWNKKTEEMIFTELGIAKLNENEKLIFDDGYKVITSYKDQQVYNTNDQYDSKKCEEDTCPDGFTTEKPISDYPCKWSTNKWIIDIEKVKELKRYEIRNALDNNLSNGVLKSVVLGIDVDCRRSGYKNDLQNVHNLISYMTRNSVNSIDYRGYCETKNSVELAMLSSLAAEMEDYTLALYEKKWSLISRIESAATIEEIKAISWNP